MVVNFLYLGGTLFCPYRWYLPYKVHELVNSNRGIKRIRGVPLFAHITDTIY